MGEPREASYVEADLIKAGEAFDPTLPHNRATAGAGVTFDPAWSETSADPSLLAYCMYSFSVPGYDRNPQVRLTWSAPPLVIGEAWIGLGHWGPNRWDWYQCTAGGIIDMPAIDPYIAFGGGLLLCVAVHGSSDCTLAEVRIGTQLPQPTLTPKAWRGFAPLGINLSAAASVDPDGSITKYEWDLDGDGTFETDTGLTAEIAHEYTTPGTFHPAVRVTDDDGLTAVAVSEIGAASEFARTWGAMGADSGSGIAVDSAGNLYQVGSTYLVGDGKSAQIVKYDAVGQPVWSAAFDGTGEDSYADIVIGADGMLYVCGTTTSFGSGMDDGLLQCWSPAGELIWSKVWGGEDVDIFRDMVFSGESIYVVGQSKSFCSTSAAAIAVFSTGGGLIWDKQFGGDYDAHANAIARSKPLVGDPRLHVVGWILIDPPANYDVLYYVLDEGGHAYKRRTFGHDGPEEGIAVVAPSLFASETIIVGLSYVTLLTTDILIVSVDDLWSKTWNSGYDDKCHDVIRLPNGNFLIAGSAFVPSLGALDAVLLTVTGAGVGAGLEFRDFNGQDDVADSLCSYPGGVIISGSALDNTGAWQASTVVLNNTPGSWSDCYQGVVDADATVMNASGSVLPVPGAVLDDGGGSSDFLYELRKL